MILLLYMCMPHLKMLSTAIILVANRTANVPGRIIFLIVSIHTINDIEIGSVP